MDTTATVKTTESVAMEVAVLLFYHFYIVHWTMKEKFEFWLTLRAHEKSEGWWQRLWGKIKMSNCHLLIKLLAKNFQTKFFRFYISIGTTITIIIIIVIAISDSNNIVIRAEIQLKCFTGQAVLTLSFFLLGYRIVKLCVWVVYVCLWIHSAINQCVLFSKIKFFWIPNK